MIKIKEIEFLTHCHATENCNKVITALLNLLPPEQRNKVYIEKQTLPGHYGNPITIIKCKIRDETDKVIQYIAEKLSDTEKSLLTVSLDLRYDKRTNKIYIRVNKQEAYRGKIMLDDGDDVIKIIINLSGTRRIEKIREILREKGLIK